MGKLIRTNLADQIFNYIKECIQSGKWKPDEKIPSENELAAALGVSRISVRSAIQKANTMGLTRTQVGEGTFVRHFSMDTYISELYQSKLLEWNVQDLNDLRQIMELGAIELAWEKGISPEEMEKVTNSYTALQSAAKAEDLEAFCKEDSHFHRLICKLAGNSLLDMFYEAIFSLLSKAIAQNVQKSFHIHGNMDVIMQFHQDLYNGICKKDIHLLRNAYKQSRIRGSQYYGN